MNPEHAPIAEEPVWNVIGKAVKAGQDHEESVQLRAALAKILGKSDVPGTHAGVAAVASCLREGDAKVIGRLVAWPEPTTARLLLAIPFTERAWRRYERDHPTGPVIVRHTEKAYSDVNNDNAFAHEPALAEAWNRYSAYFSRQTPDEQFGTGVSGQINPMLGWVEAASLGFQNDHDARVAGPQELDAIVTRSIPALARGYSSMSMGHFQTLIAAAALPEKHPIGRGQRPEHKQDPGKYRLIRDHARRRVLTVVDEVRAVIPAVIVSVGCAAKFAKTENGRSVVSRLCDRFLHRWRMEILPLLTEDGSITTSSFSGYYQALQQLRP